MLKDDESSSKDPKEMEGTDVKWRLLDSTSPPAPSI